MNCIYCGNKINTYEQVSFYKNDLEFYGWTGDLRKLHSSKLQIFQRYKIYITKSLVLKFNSYKLTHVFKKNAFHCSKCNKKFLTNIPLKNNKEKNIYDKSARIITQGIKTNRMPKISR